ncbi:MAG: S8 family serine peptidase [Candidatus Sericytochromatia bacterium]
MKKLITSTSFLVFTITLGCSISTNINTIKQDNTYKNKIIPYYGDVNIEIDTSLGNNIKEARKFKLEEDKNSFSVQSFNNKDSIFSKNLKIENTEKEVNYSFSIIDKTKKYVLFAYKERKNDKLEVKINNISQINSLDFSNDNDVSKPILFDENNEISIKYSGNKNDNIFVSIVESAKVENIRKKIGNIKWKEITKNSSNITLFNPNDLNSLGGLLPYEGDKNDNNIFIASSLINDKNKVFENGYLSLTIKEPFQENLQKLLLKLHSNDYKIDDFNGNKIVIFKINYAETNLSNILPNLKELNTFNIEPIKNISFSSINSAKTIATFIDILVNYSDLVSNAGLLTELKQNGGYTGGTINSDGSIVTEENYSDNIIPFTYTNTLNYNNKEINNSRIHMTVPSTSIKHWYLKDSNVIKAWKYSIGENVNIGVFDYGFGEYNQSGFINNKKYLTYALNIDSNLNVNDVKFSQRLSSLSCPTLEYDPANTTNIYCKDSFGRISHGFWVSSIIASDINDKKGIAGVSPKSKLSLFTYEGGAGVRGLANALHNHKDYIINNLDIINFSSGSFLTVIDRSFPKNNQTSCKTIYKSTNNNDVFVCDPIIKQLSTEITEISNTKKDFNGQINTKYDPNRKSVIFVSSSGNENNLLSKTDSNYFFIPSSFSDVISVGAYELKDIESGDRVRADFHPKESGTNGFLSSNYGDIDIWAPGDNIPIYIPYKNYWEIWEMVKGTSFASPIVASSLGLAKSIKPDLDVFEARKLLQETGQPLTHSSFNANPNYPPKALDAEALVKKVAPIDKVEAISLTVSSYPTETHLEFQDGINIVGKNLKNPGLKLVFKNLTTGALYKRDLIDGSNNYTLSSFEFNPERFIKEGNASLNLKTDSSTTGSKFKISIENNTGSSEFLGEYTVATDNTWKIRMYNVDDTSYAYVNLNGNYQRTSYATDTTIDITDRMNQGDNNRFDLKTYNIAGGYTWGFEVIKYGRVVYREEAGQAGVIGANNNDQNKTQRYVFDKTITIPSTIRNSNEISIRDNLSGPIVFESSREENKSELYLMDEYGGNQRRLTYNSSGTSYYPALSPNKDKVAFMSTVNGQEDIFVVNIDGTGLKNLTEGNLEHDYLPVWSYDGKKIVYTSEINGTSEIFIMDVDGSNKKNLTNVPLTRDREASLSSGGNKIVFHSGRDGNNEIYVMNIDGSGVTRLTNNNANDHSPKWSPDGTKIIYESNESNPGTNIYNLWSIQPDGNDKKKITTSDDYGVYWSPDGSKIGFNRYISSTRSDAYIYDFSNNTERLISASGKNEYVTDWQTDASGLFISSDKNGNYDIYKSDIFGNLLQLTTNPARDFNATNYNPRKTFSILNNNNKFGKMKRPDN